MKEFLTLSDENGVDTTYEIVDRVTYNGKEYVAIVPTEYYVLKKIKSEKKEDTFESVEGKELDDLCAVFDRRLNVVDHDQK